MDAQFQIISLLQKNLKQSILLQWIALLAEHLFTVSWPSGNMQEGHIIQTIEIYVCCSWGHEQNLSEGSEGLQESWLWQSRWQNCPDTVAFFICPWHWYQGGSSCCGRGLGPSHFFLSNSGGTTNTACRTSGVPPCSLFSLLFFFFPIYFRTYYLALLFPYLPRRHF